MTKRDELLKAPLKSDGWGRKYNPKRDPECRTCWGQGACEADAQSLLQESWVVCPDCWAEASDPIQEQFLEFHKDNPEVFKRLARLALQWRDKRGDKVGIGMLFEVLRWSHLMETDDSNCDFKLNNNYRSRYVRLLMERHPKKFRDLFELRTCIARSPIEEVEDETP